MTTAGKITPADPVRKIMAELLAETHSEESLRAIARQLVAEEIGAVIISVRGGPARLISERNLITVLASGGDLDRPCRSLVRAHRRRL